MVTPEKMRRLADELIALYCKKREGYGDSFGSIADLYRDTLGQNYDVIACLPRIMDKALRFQTLAMHLARIPIHDVESDFYRERARDTLIDLAAYALMTLAQMDGESG